MEVSIDSKEKEDANQDLVSFDDVMDTADCVANTFENFVLSQVSDKKAHKQTRSIPLVRTRCLRRLLELTGQKTTFMSLESSDTEYSSNGQISISINEKVLEDTCVYSCSTIQGRKEPVFIHFSSDSEEDAEID